MLMLITYDVTTINPAGRRRLRRVAKACLDYGQRVQNSVFECEVDPAQWAVLRGRLVSEIKIEEDSLRFYRLGADGKRRVEHVGTKPTTDLSGPLLF
jgi:CRISPR-associated protein Cas2